MAPGSIGNFPPLQFEGMSSYRAEARLALTVCSVVSSQDDENSNNITSPTPCRDGLDHARMTLLQKCQASALPTGSELRSLPATISKRCQRKLRALAPRCEMAQSTLRPEQPLLTVKQWYSDLAHSQVQHFPMQLPEAIPERQVLPFVLRAP